MTDPSAIATLISNRIRQRVQVQLDAVDGLSPYAPDHDRHEDKGLLHGSFDLREVPLESSREGRAGAAVNRMRRQLKALIYPLLETQTVHNAAATRLLTYLLEQYESEGLLLRTLEGRAERADSVIERLEARVHELEQAIREPSLVLERRALADAIGPGEPEMIEALREVAARLAGAAGEIVDLGCGRGELLELLRAAGANAYGVDPDLGMVSRCQEKELRVVRADVIEHLDGLPRRSLGAIFANGIVESWHAVRIVALARLARRTLQPGGTLVVRGTDPADPAAVAALLEDPVAARPYGPIGLAAVFEQEGFAGIEVQRTAGMYVITASSPA